MLRCLARLSQATYTKFQHHTLEFHHLPRVGSKQLTAFAHLECTREADIFQQKITHEDQQTLCMKQNSQPGIQSFSYLSNYCTEGLIDYQFICNLSTYFQIPIYPILSRNIIILISLLPSMYGLGKQSFAHLRGCENLLTYPYLSTKES